MADLQTFTRVPDIKSNSWGQVYNDLSNLMQLYTKNSGKPVTPEEQNSIIISIANKYNYNIDEFKSRISENTNALKLYEEAKNKGLTANARNASQFSSTLLDDSDTNEATWLDKYSPGTYIPSVLKQTVKSAVEGAIDLGGHVIDLPLDLYANKNKLLSYITPGGPMKLPHPDVSKPHKDPPNLSDAIRDQYNITNRYLHNNKFTKPILESNAWIQLTDPPSPAKGDESLGHLAAFLVSFNKIQKALPAIKGAPKWINKLSGGTTAFIGSNLIVGSKDETFLGNYLEEFPKLAPYVEDLAIRDDDVSYQRLVKNIIDAAGMGTTFNVATATASPVLKPIIEKAIKASQSLRNIINKSKAIKEGIVEPENLAKNNTNVKEIEVNKKPDGKFNWKINLSEPVTLISDPNKAKSGGFFKRYFNAEQAFDPKTYRAFVTWDNAPKSLAIALKNQDKNFFRAIETAYGKPFDKLDDTTIALINTALGKRPVIGFNAPSEIKTILKKPATKLTKNDKELLEAYYTEILSTAKSNQAAALDQLPENVKKELIKMRVMVDTQSKYMLDNFGLSRGNTLTLEKNLGLYIADDYPLFTRPEWLRQVKNAIVNKGATDTEAYQAVLQAKKMLKEMLPKNTSADEIEGLLLTYVNQYVKDRASAIDMLKLGQSDAISQNKFGKLLTKRKDIDKPFRLILGEEKNPIVRWNNTMRNMSAIISEHKFMNTIKGIAESQYGSNLFSVGKTTSTGNLTEDLSNLASGYLINAGKNSNPLVNIFTTPEYKKYLQQGIELGKANPTYAWWYTASGLTNSNATSLSANTHLRNMEGNIFFLAMNGNLGPSLFKNFVPTIKDLTKATPQSLDRLRFFAETGLINSGVRAQQLIRTLDEAVKNPNGWFEKIKTRTIDVANSAYSIEDDVFKILSFYKERARYKAAFPNKTAQELDQYAIKIVTDTMPTYHKLIRPVKQLRRTPFGTFPAFTHEVFRTTQKALRIALNDIRVGTATGNLALVRAGAARIAGTTASAVGAQQYIQYNYDRYKISANDREAIDAVSQPWQKHEIRDYDNFIHWNPKTNSIQTSYKNLTYTLPHAPIIQIVQQLYPYLMSEKGKEDFENGNLNNFNDVMNALEESLSVFTDESLLAGQLLDVVRGTTDTGRPIYGKADPLGEKALTAILHLAKVIIPGAGTIKTVQNIRDSKRSEEINDAFRKGYGVTDKGWGNKYSDRIKSLSGVKHETLDLSKSFISATNSKSADVRDANNYLKNFLKNSYNIDWTNPNDVEKIKKEFNQRLEYSINKQKDLAKLFLDFKKLKYYKDEKIKDKIIQVERFVGGEGGRDDSMILDLLTDGGTKIYSDSSSIGPIHGQALLQNDDGTIAGFYNAPSLTSIMDDLQKNQNIPTDILQYFENLLVQANGTPLLEITQEEE